MLILIIIILGVSFILYTLLGGADFGAGIVETFAGKREERTISKAMAPVWEANHVWLILAVVILFTGFPSVYASLSWVLHIPLMMVLLGIIMRGTAFTFRHYDVHQGRSHQYYSFLFRVSSFITPVFLGMILGAMILGRISLDRSEGFYNLFIAPWLNWFCFTMGVFTSCLFAYLASVFLVGETNIERERMKYAKFSKLSMIFTMILGLLVFIMAEAGGHSLTRTFLHTTPSIIMLVIAALLCPLIWHFLNKEKNKTIYLRVGTGIQVSAILMGWFYIQFPVLIEVKNAGELTFYNTQAPAATLEQLLIALVIGLLLVIPGFVFLFRVFKIKTK
ncbi:MAG TPA: cytochrome d ubiquinol oxidase subunit II [Chitinophagaceae bacterium]|jgi:cytochrome d ubiquinol oxidase subunit II|nr:cytochrome d ubiquinol oxidase subunit II [Chitinophagaceae bacterium]